MTALNKTNEFKNKMKDYEMTKYSLKLKDVFILLCNIFDLMETQDV